MRQNCVTLHVSWRNWLFAAFGLDWADHFAVEAALSAVDHARPRESALYLGQELAASATGRMCITPAAPAYLSFMSVSDISGLLSQRMQMRSRGKM